MSAGSITTTPAGPTATPHFAPPPAADPATALGLGLRVAVATTLCLLLTEVFRLKMTSLAVYSAHMVMAQFTFTSFQKGIERIVGRVLGVAYGLALVMLFRQTPMLYFLLLAVGMVGFFYIFAANRLAYTALNGGLFVAFMAVVGLTAPGTAQVAAVNLIQQIIIGVGVAFLINWVSDAERQWTIAVPGEPLWPPRSDWLSRAGMIATAQMGTLLATLLLELPAVTTTISAAIIATAGDWRAMEHKAVQRAWGAAGGGGYAMAAMFLLYLMPRFVLLLALVFAGMFLAAYFTRVLRDWSYVALQAGLVMPMVLIGSNDSIGSLALGYTRLQGVVIALIISEIVYFLWPWQMTLPTAAVSVDGERETR
jgi:uncharacterized membrane protein YccC